MNNTPLEFDEQCTLVEWMECRGIKFTAIPNSTYTKSARQKWRNTKSGLRAGFPDLVIIIPRENSRSKLIFLEMKRQKGSKTSEEQEEWHEALRDAGEHVHVCYGCDEAIEVLTQYAR